MKKIKLIILWFFPLVLLGAFYVGSQASIYPPNCICQVKAMVLKVTEIPADRYSGQEQTVVNMKIQIIKAEKIIGKGISEKMTCDIYAPGRVLDVHASRDSDFIDKSLVITPNSIIRAYIEYSGDENGQWYNFNHIEKAAE